MNDQPALESSRLPSLIHSTCRGLAAGFLAGLLMLAVMVCLRLFLGVATPIEMIFDRLFPFLTVKFFISSLVKAGGYSALKLQGIYGALAGQAAVAAFGGAVYALYLDRFAVRRDSGGGLVDARGWMLIVPGVLVVWLLLVGLLWPNTVTNFHGLPPARARIVTALAMLFDFAVCGVGIMFFDRLLRPTRVAATRSVGTAPSEGNYGRRAFLAGGLGAVLAVLTGGVLRRFYQIGTFSYDGRQYGGPGVQKITPISPDDEFYQVSKNFVDPEVVRNSWGIEVAGEVEAPRTFSYEEIAAMPAVEQETTLLCISYGVGSGLCSNAVWKGVPLPVLLAQVQPKPTVSTVLFRAADGYYETFDFKKAMEPTTLLAYGMNGLPLPQRHGYPLRMIVPGRYGEKNPKWITRIELLDENDGRLHRRHGCGFYKEQGWGPNDVVPTHSRIDAPQVNGGGFADAFKVGQRVELRGVAMGGDRGISKVEISLNDGQTYEPAEIYEPGTKISWSLWRYVWTPKEASNEVRISVRAVDGEGRQQIEDFRDQVPHGATGLHRVSARVKNA